MNSQPNLKSIANKVGKLPTLPGVATKIMQAMQRETPNLSEISEIISSDAPLSARVLKVVNSPFYGLSNKITSVHQAMVYLGLNTVKSLALSFSLLKGFAPKKKGSFDYVQFSKDSLIGAVAAKLLTEKTNRQQGENAFFLGLLQNIGILIMAESMPAEYEKVISEAASSGSPLHEVESKLLDVNHMQVGAFVTDSWGMPATFRVPIGFHHCPDCLDSSLDDIGQLTKILHLSSLYIDLFKSSDLNAGYARIEKYIQAYGFNSVIDKSAIAEQITEGIKSIFPIFEIQIDEKRYIEIIDAARIQLADLSSELLNQVHSQAHCLDQLRQQVGLDGMTNLYNHKRFYEILHKELSHASRYKNPLSLIMSDVDHFKSINDFFGHQAGDHALKCLSAHLKNLLRDSDQIARYGGEEFAIILPMTPAKDALLAAERYRKSIESLKIIYNERNISVTMSFGVASYEKKREVDVEGLIKMADEALYDAKNTGRNKTCLYKNTYENNMSSITVLVIDDEEGVLVTVTKMLERLGYAVLPAKSCHEAKDFLNQNRDEIDMVIMDMVMPEMNPDQTLSAIRDFHPRAKVVLSSGYSLSSKDSANLLKRADGFLQKPYQLSELSQFVETTLRKDFNWAS
jgi:diguanylate cyclase (GGDEF)-like protein